MRDPTWAPQRRSRPRRHSCKGEREVRPSRRNRSRSSICLHFGFFFNGCLVSHGLYQAIISTVQQYPPTNNFTLHLHYHVTATIHDPNLQQYNSTTPHYHRHSTVQPPTYHIHDSNLQQYLNNSTVPYIHRSTPISHTFLTALRSTLAARDLY